MEIAQNFKRSNKTLIKKYLEFFISMLLSTLFLQFTTVVDTIIVGQLLGTTPMSGIKIAMPIINILTIFATFIGVGSSTIISIFMGRRKTKEVNISFTFSLLACVLIGGILAAIISPLSNQIASLLSNDAEIISHAATYIRIVMGGGIFFILASVFAILFRSDGFTKLSMIVLVTGGLMNVCFDLIFMKVLNLGVAGSAYATFLGMVLACFVGLTYFFFKHHSFKFANIFNKENKTILKGLIKPISKTGLSSALRLLFTNLSLIVINIFIGKQVGVFGIAVMTICSNMQLILSAFFTAGGQAMMPFCGVLYGSKDNTGIKLLLKFVFSFICCLVVILIVIVEIIAPQIYSLFNVADPNNQGAFYLRIYLIGILPVAINYILVYYFSTIQKQKYALLIAFLENILLYLPLAIGLLYPLAMTGIVIAFIIAELLTILITLLIVHLEKKKKNLSNLMLLPDNPPELIYEATTSASLENISNITKEIHTILVDKNVPDVDAYKTALAIEEMLSNAANIDRNKKRKVYFDISILYIKDNITISLRDNGVVNNPIINLTDEDYKENFESVVILNKVAKSIKYNRVMELNHTIIEI